MRIKAEMESFGLDSDVQVGDEFEFVAKARVVGIAEDLIDVTPIGGKEACVPGERRVSLYISKAKVLEEA